MSEEILKIILLIVVILWTIPWKAVSLWKSARNGDKFWFILLLIVNTLAILDILYIFFFSRKKVQEDRNFKLEQA